MLEIVSDLRRLWDVNTGAKMQCLNITKKRCQK